MSQSLPKKTGIKIPKPLVKEILLQAWKLAHLDDYRCQIWIADDEAKKKLLKDWIQIPQGINSYYSRDGIELIETFEKKLTIN